ncbi:hypothetical protein E1B28_006536 [Marasmius oreades]|uniref:Hyaluronan/mRNA-binding protein domain-containing protein n=1 Tax=Marasmius oreades TaxID=181124 RepID=A0A9P7S7S6_9AGAR|nr:uncharacterized protein E1B28_006536 [Marasmius oreades]KAG7095841.1 hypothetical protein E1B28_006536 [Marasmius oreades]
MTRTERSAFPRAVMRDRSLSKSGLEKSLRKEGGGAHNWGRLEDEWEHQTMEDDVREDDERFSTSGDAADKVAPMIPSPSMTEEELEAAKQFRKHAFKKGQIDLASIARTSNAVSSSPPKATIASDTSSNASA